jgi:hypothetical protein
VRKPGRLSLRTPQVSPLASTSLPSGQAFGAYRDATGVLHVLTRTAGRVALFAPGKWGDPRFVSTRIPQVALITEPAVAHRPDGTTLIFARLTLDTQAHLYVSLLTPHGQALLPQTGTRVGWWLTGKPTKTLQTLQLRPGTFPIRLRVTPHELSSPGRYTLRLAAIDPYGRHVQLVIPLPHLP